MTEQYQADKAMTRRVATLEVAASAAAGFLRQAAWEESLPDVLVALGTATGVNRVEVAEWLSHDAADHRLRYRWWWTDDGSCGDEAPKDAELSAESQSFEPAQWKHSLLNGEPVFGRPTDFEDDVNASLVARGIRAIALIPIAAGRTLWGRLSVIDTSADRERTAAEIDALVTVADTLGAAIERQQDERVLRYLEQAVETLSVGVTVRDVDGHIVYTNPAEASIHGYSTDEISGMSARQLAPEESWRVDRKPDASWLIGWRRERLNRRKDGSIFPVQLTSVALKDETDTPVAVATVCEDISERKRIEEALRRSEEHYRGLFQAAKDAIIVFDPDDHIVIDVNPRACQIYGFGRSEFVGRPLTAITKDFSRERDHIGETLEGEHLHHYETVHLRADSSELLLDVTASVLEKGGRDVILSINRDISERKLAQEALEESREQLRNLADHLQAAREEERMALARTIHDELGQVLTALKMDVSWLKKRLPSDSEASHVKAQIMLDLLDEAVNTVQRLSTELRPALLDDLGLAAAAEWYSRDFATRTGIECRLDLLEPELRLDRSRSTAVFRILQEALTNVARHAEATSVDIHLGFDDDAIVLSVRDNGQGIGKDQLKSSRSFGLLGMQERAAALGGEATVCCLADGGTQVVAKIPAPQEKGGRGDQRFDL
jgi:two-component system sensor histidine kinase UhpB